MSDAADEALQSVLAADRTSAQRLKLLKNLRDELRGERAILALLAAAREEKSLELRRAFFKHVLATDITRLSDRDAFIAGLIHFAAFEDDADLRKRAVAELAPFQGHSPQVEDVLVETLSAELELDIQQAALTALLAGKGPRPENAAKLLDFVPRAHEDLRQALISLFVRLDGETAQSGLTVFLHPDEVWHVRQLALVEVVKLPKLLPETVRALEALLLNDPSPELQMIAMSALNSVKDINPELFNVIFAMLMKYPDRSDLLQGLQYRIASFPPLLALFTERFRALRSARLRARVLKLLENAPAGELFTTSLRDPSPQVRLAAIRCCAEHLDVFCDAIEAAAVSAAADETVVRLRAELAKLFATDHQHTPEVERALVAWFERETEPRVERELAQSLAGIPLSGENGRAVLRAYKKLLLDPATAPEQRAAIVNRLGDAAFGDAPELAACLRALLERATEIEDVENLYARLRELEPDASAHADLLLTLFFRFAANYPRSPLDGWIKDFQALAPTHDAIRAQIPTIVRMTGATWLTGSAETGAQKSILLPALMEQIRKGNWIESGRLLREAWEGRTLRKSDLLVFFKKLLRISGEDSLMQSSLVLMAKGGLVTPEILDICFGYIQEYPRGDGRSSYTTLLADFVQGKNQDHTPMRSIDEVRVDLEAARQQDPAYRERVFAAFQQRGLDRFWRGIVLEMEYSPPPKDWNDWEYQGWPDKSKDWVIARMFFALKPYDRIATLLKGHISPAVAPSRSIQYLLLLHLWHELATELPPAVLDELLRATGELIRKTADRPGFELLHDRAVLVFQKYWTRQINSHTGGRAVTQDMADLAAEVYVALCGIGANFDAAPEAKFPSKFPELLQGLNAAKVQALWKFGDNTWECLFKEHFEGAEDDAKAKALFDRAQAAENDTRFEEAFALYSELQANFATNRFFTKVRNQVAYGLDDCDPNRAIDPRENEGAKAQYEFLQTLLQQNKPDPALRTLERLLKRWWRTPLIQEKRAELTDLRTQLKGRVKPD